MFHYFTNDLLNAIILEQLRNTRESIIVPLEIRFFDSYVTLSALYFYIALYIAFYAYNTICGIMLKNRID